MFCIWFIILSNVFAQIPPWSEKWQATQIIEIPELNAIQSGYFVYDYPNNRIREDQYTFQGKVPTYSKNMTEFFFGNQWYFIDWVANTCETTSYGIGPVKPDWFLSNSTREPNVFLYDRFGSKRYVNASWIYLDWFGVFEYFVESDTLTPLRLRMPGATSLSGMTLVVDLKNYTTDINVSLFDLPDICKKAKPYRYEDFHLRKNSLGWFSTLLHHIQSTHL